MHRHELGRVSGKTLHRNSRHDLLRLAAFYIEQGHLAAFDQGVIIFADVADRIAFQLHVPMLHFSAMGKVSCVRKCRDYLSLWRARRIPSAMIKMQMGVDDNVYAFRFEAYGGKSLRQLFLCAVNAAQFITEFVTNSCLNGNYVFSR